MGIWGSAWGSEDPHLPGRPKRSPSVRRSVPCRASLWRRDLKSKNILLTRDGRAKISDVGLAQLGEEDPWGAGTFAWAGERVGQRGESAAVPAGVARHGVPCRTVPHHAARM